MKVIGIDHIGIAVQSIDKGSPFWEHILGIKSSGREEVLEEGGETGIYNTGRGKIELLESVKSESAIQKFLDNKGEGIHHICLKVEDIYSSISELKEKGISVIYPTPKKGAEGFLVTFIHPTM
jgi:methylmalonyl-CoA epimerase